MLCHTSYPPSFLSSCTPPFFLLCPLTFPFSYPPLPSLTLYHLPSLLLYHPPPYPTLYLILSPLPTSQANPDSPQGDPDTPPQKYFTIMVERIPGHLRSAAALYKFFEKLFPGMDLESFKTLQSYWCFRILLILLIIIFICSLFISDVTSSSSPFWSHFEYNRWPTFSIFRPFLHLCFLSFLSPSLPLTLSSIYLPCPHPCPPIPLALPPSYLPVIPLLLSYPLSYIISYPPFFSPLLTESSG